MSDKCGSNIISSISPDPKITYPIVLGKSFFVNKNKRRPTGFVAATYRFKPSSVDQSKPGHISFENTNATLQFERRTNINNGKIKKQKIQFQGESKLASDREFFLWFDASSQKMVLERSGIQIKQLKHDREQKKKTATAYNDKSKERLKQMDEKHKKKARQKNNKKKKSNTKINNNKPKSVSPHSSQSISPHQTKQFRHINNDNNNHINNNNNNNNNHINNNNNNNNNNNYNGPKPLFGSMQWDDDSDDDESDNERLILKN